MRELIDKHIDWYVGVIGFIAIGCILVIGLKK